jgi:hypothetical protein
VYGFFVFPSDLGIVGLETEVIQKRVSFKDLPQSILEGCKGSWEVSKQDAKSITFEYVSEFQPIVDAYKKSQITSQKDYDRLMGYIFPDFPKTDVILTHDRIDPKVNEIFGSLLKKILEGAGYVVSVEIPEYYFPSPTSAALVVPAFGYGLSKKPRPFDEQEGYESTITYLSIEKPLSSVHVQLKLLDSLEDRIYEYQKLLSDALTPYGLKCLYLAMAECSRNNRQNWFTLDTSYCLDRLGYKRNKKNVHQTRSKNRLLKEFEALTKIVISVVNRQPKWGKTERALKFTDPILFIHPGKVEEWEVGKGQPIESGTHITDRIRISIHKEIYAGIKDSYALIPDDYLTIDPGRRPHAIQLYPQIANQWRIGLSEHRGVIRQKFKRILEDSGLIHTYLKKRSNKKPEFIESIKDTLVWFKNQKQYWVESVEFKSARNRDPLEQIVIIKMSKDHPHRHTFKTINAPKKTAADKQGKKKG